MQCSNQVSGTHTIDILIDLARRETRTFSNRFARLLMNDLKTAVHLHKRPLKSAGFRVLKAPDVPSSRDSGIQPDRVK